MSGMSNNCKCLRSDCPRIRRTRGLCYVCYGKLMRSIHNGVTTWEKAEQEGLCLAAKSCRDWMVGFRAGFG